MRLRILEAAEEDLAEASNWYEEQNAGLGRRFLAAVGETLKRIRNIPEGFARLEGVPESEEIRRTQVKGFPYLIVFRLEASEVLVTAVGHTARGPRFWQSRVRNRETDD
jgi:plasmid stabilization system protein ParE